MKKSIVFCLFLGLFAGMPQKAEPMGNSAIVLGPAVTLGLVAGVIGLNFAAGATIHSFLTLLEKHGLFFPGFSRDWRCVLKILADLAVGGPVGIVGGGVSEYLFAGNGYACDLPKQDNNRRFEEEDEESSE